MNQGTNAVRGWVTNSERISVVEERLRNTPDKDDLLVLERRIHDLDKSIDAQTSTLKEFIGDAIKDLNEKIDNKVEKAEGKNLRWWAVTIVATIIIASPAGSEVLQILLNFL